MHPAVVTCITPQNGKPKRPQLPQAARAPAASRPKRTRQHVQTDTLHALLDGPLHQQHELVVPASTKGRVSRTTGC